MYIINGVRRRRDVYCEKENSLQIYFKSIKLLFIHRKIKKCLFQGRSSIFFSSADDQIQDAMQMGQGFSEWTTPHFQIKSIYKEDTVDIVSLILAHDRKKRLNLSKCTFHSIKWLCELALESVPLHVVIRTTGTEISFPR